MQRSTEGKFESVKPLTQEQADRLEQNSLGLEMHSKDKGKSHKRTMSADGVSGTKVTSPPVILN